MANVPGVVTDPGRIKGGVIALPSGGTVATVTSSRRSLIDFNAREEQMK